MDKETGSAIGAINAALLGLYIDLIDRLHEAGMIDRRAVARDLEKTIQATDGKADPIVLMVLQQALRSLQEPEAAPASPSPSQPSRLVLRLLQGGKPDTH